MRLENLKITNPELIRLVRLLRKAAKENEASIWKAVAENLAKPRRKRIAVNVSRINRYSKDGDEVVVLGKVLGAGLINHPVKVAALDFSDQARQKIIKARGKCLSIPELIKASPKGSNVKIIG